MFTAQDEAEVKHRLAVGDPVALIFLDAVTAGSRRRPDVVRDLTEGCLSLSAIPFFRSAFRAGTI